ncbi:hypothetical protein INR49_003474 [Caranx melampygus]|nr:hypothetical protein INR49_003474 [Caranx melampygus]
MLVSTPASSLSNQDKNKFRLSRFICLLLLKGGNVDMEDVYQSCKTTVSFNTSHLQHKSKYEELFSCHVTSANSRELQINFAPQTLEEGTGVPNGYATTPQQAPTHYSVLTPIMLVMRIAEVILITVIIVVIIRAQVNQKPTDDNTVPETVKSRTEMRSGPESSQVQNNGDELYVTMNYENSSVTLH